MAFACVAAYAFAELIDNSLAATAYNDTTRDIEIRLVSVMVMLHASATSQPLLTSLLLLAVSQAVVVVRLAKLPTRQDFPEFFLIITLTPDFPVSVIILRFLEICR